MSFYGDAVNFRAYSKNRGKTVLPIWTDAVVEAALLLSSEWLDNRYENVWSGYPTDGFTQVLKWPRTAALTNTCPQHVFGNNEIPDNVKNAVYEAAFRELTTNGVLEKDYTPSKYTKVAVSDAVSVEYDNSLTASDMQLQIPIIESLMNPLIDPDSKGSFSSYSGSLSRI